MDINIPGIDLEKAIKNSGSEELFIELLCDVYKLMDEKSNLVETYMQDKDLQNDTILIHSLKTTCRMIGAMDLGEDLFTLEKLGKENNLDQIEKLTPGILSSFRSLKPYLEPYASNGEGPQNHFDKGAVTAILNKLIEAIDDFDLGAAEDATKQLFSYKLDKELTAKVDDLDKLIANLDYNEAKELAGQILNSL